MSSSLKSTIRRPRHQRSIRSRKFLRVDRPEGNKTLTSVTWIKVATEADSEAEVVTITRAAALITLPTVNTSMVVRSMTTMVVVTSIMEVEVAITLPNATTTTRVECLGSTMGLARSVQINLPQVMVGRKMPIVMSADSSKDGMRLNDICTFGVSCRTLFD